MRRLLLVLLPIVGAVSGGLVAFYLGGGPEYRGEVVFVVPATIGDESVGRASEAYRLAQTLARLVPNDTAVVDGLADALEVPSDTVRRKLSAVSEPDTSILRVRYTDESEDVALEAAEFLSTSLAPDPVTEAISADSLVVTRLPEVEDLSGALPLTVAVGAIAGFMGGLFVSAVIRRVRPAVTTDAIAAGPIAQLPRTDVTWDQLKDAQGLLTRWTETLEDPDAVLALVVTTRSKVDVNKVRSVVESFALSHPIRVTTAEGMANYVFSSQDRRCVLVTSLGAPLSGVERTYRVACDFGFEPVWLLVMKKPSAKS